MISVPQLIAASIAASLSLGIVASYATSALGKALHQSLRKAKIVQGKSGKNHYTLAPSSVAKAIASKYVWYSPQFSPKDVPRFYDVASITECPATFRSVINVLADRYRVSRGPTHIAGYDARGFAIGAPLALELGIPFVLLRKDAKSPGVLVESASYDKEYAEEKLDKMCLRVGSIDKGSRVVLVDDLIATGGTAISGMQLVQELGATVYEFTAILSLPFLGGVEKIRAYKGGVFRDTSVFTLLDDDTIGDANCGDPPKWAEGLRVVPTGKAGSLAVQYKLR